MDELVYVYAVQGTQNDIRTWADRCLSGEYEYWCGDAFHLELGNGFPPNPRFQGSVFNHQGEVHWQQNGSQYDLLLLMDNPVSGLDLASERLGEWRSPADHIEILLQDLNEQRVSPIFDQYPTGDSQGKLRARIYQQNGMALLVSPRAFVKGE